MGLVILLSLIGGADAKTHHLRVHHHNIPFHTHTIHSRISTLEVVDKRPKNCYGIPWCGCYMRTRVSHDPGPAYNLAANWARFGHASELVVDAIVVHRHHVDMVQKVLGNSKYLAVGGNSHRDNLVHTYINSTIGAIAIRHE